MEHARTQAIIAAGFRLEEYAVIRCTLDAIGAPHLKLLIAEEKLLHSDLSTALTMPEIDWQAPRPPDWIQGGAWGSKRAILFSGLSVAQQVLPPPLSPAGCPHGSQPGCSSVRPSYSMGTQRQQNLNRSVACTACLSGDPRLYIIPPSPRAQHVGICRTGNGLSFDRAGVCVLSNLCLLQGLEEVGSTTSTAQQHLAAPSHQLQL